MRFSFTVLFLSVFYLATMAQTTISLWPEGQIPNDLKNTAVQEKIETGKDGILRISDVKEPNMAVYVPAKPNGASVLICPGGGYWIEAAGHEGTDIAKWFNSFGVTAFVLKYRLPDVKLWSNFHEVPLQDALQAMKLIRANAKKYNLDPVRVGVMGFSAGGHLAATLSTRWSVGGAEAKPNFSILMYPVITAGESKHAGSFERLLGKTPTPEMLELYSNEKQVTAQTPPTLLVHATDDKAVPVENSILYYSALKKFNIPASLLVYENGGHGFGLAKDKKGSVQNWSEHCQQWLNSMGYLKSK
ncbi:MAG: alpha/beta hydrolase [Runella slithyformis]|nr:MAG: alpha/beta hydrolase [Runella slithyformis]